MAPKAADGCGDLAIRVVSRRLVKASDPSIQPHVASLSNLDLYTGNSQESILCLYPKLPTAGDFAAVVTTFESVLPRLLNDFYPLAGRIGTNPSSGLPELLCHNQGVELVVGEVGVALGSLDYGLADKSLKKIRLPFAQDVALTVQLLSFACGSFSVLWGNNHLLCDGHGIITLVRMWSELARTGRIIANHEKPSHDRSLFSPRDPPSYKYSRGSVTADLTTFDQHKLVNALTAHESFVDRLYYIEAGDIATLREMASTELQRVSRVQAVSAYLWKVLAGVVATSRVPEERCRMGWWVSARRRFTSPELASAASNFFGNITTYAQGDATVEEIQRKSLAEVAAMARESITSVNYDEYIQDLVDYVEVHKGQGLMVAAVVGLGSPTITQSVLGSFPLDTDFGFGQAALAMPIADAGNFCSAYLSINARPGGDGSWLISAYIWPRLAATLEADDPRIFKPLTAEYLGLTAT